MCPFGHMWHMISWLCYFHVLYRVVLNRPRSIIYYQVQILKYLLRQFVWLISLYLFLLRQTAVTSFFFVLVPINLLVVNASMLWQCIVLVTALSRNKNKCQHSIAKQTATWYPKDCPSNDAHVYGGIRATMHCSVTTDVSNLFRQQLLPTRHVLIPARGDLVKV